MPDHACPHHVAVNVGHAPLQAFAGLDRSRMIAVFPVRSPSALPLVVLPGGSCGNQPHALRNLPVALVLYQQVNMIRCNHVIEHAQAVVLSGLVQPVKPAFTIPGELE